MEEKVILKYGKEDSVDLCVSINANLYHKKDSRDHCAKKMSMDQFGCEKGYKAKNTI